jgi:hypothetical protein
VHQCPTDDGWYVQPKRVVVYNIQEQLCLLDSKITL